MRCHYEVLNVARDAPLEEIKKSYKKLAIKWHPDKNLDNTEAATEQFQLLQQAFEVLSDPHERAWYDDHRDAILKGKVNGEATDDSLDVYQYFTASCYSGFGDDEKGFYSVYREVFNKIAAEDSEYYAEGDSDIEIPNFGKSGSSAKEVQEFYAYWQSYCTKKSYSWLDEYDSRQAENRRVFRLIDKENQKIRAKARKARNEEVRELVSFVRKRDKRLQEHAHQQKLLNDEKAKQTEAKRRERIKERKKELTKHQETEWSKFSNFENDLKNIEANLATEFGESISDINSDDEIIDDQLYCVACNKLFKTSKAFANHENSKKHKENVEILKTEMLEGSGSEDDISEESNVDEGEYQLEEDDEELDEFSNDPLFCKACTRKFKTVKAVEDHKKSKQHKILEKAYGELMRDALGVNEDIDPTRNVFADLKQATTVEGETQINGAAGDGKFGGAVARRICESVDELTKDNDKIKVQVDTLCKEVDDFLLDSDSSLDEFLEHLGGKQLSKSGSSLDEFLENLGDKKLSKSELKNQNLHETLDSSDDEDFVNNSKKRSKKQQKQKFQYNKCKYNNDSLLSKSDGVDSMNVDKEIETRSLHDDNLTNDSSSSKEKIQIKQSTSKKKLSKKNTNLGADTDTTCVVCSSTFPSKNKLFLHLSKTGHSVFIGDKQTPINKVGNGDFEISSKKKKNRKK